MKNKIINAIIIICALIAGFQIIIWAMFPGEPQVYLMLSSTGGFLVVFVLGLKLKG